MSTPPSKTIPDRLRELAASVDRHMRAGGLTEFSLAAKSGISPRTIGNFLRPDNRLSVPGTSTSFPSGTVANLFKIAIALGIEPWQLLRGDAAHDVFHSTVELAYLERLKADSTGGGKR